MADEFKSPDSIDDLLISDDIKGMLDKFIEDDLSDSQFVIVLSYRKGHGYDFYRSYADAIVTRGLLEHAKDWWGTRDHEDA